jgi:hypothetical protein
VVVMLTYLLAKATAEQELAEDPEESTDA